jgi:hydrogenase nickel incorporation protein HypA/HybF
MHELSIAMGIIRIAEKETKKANKKRVELIELEIGSMAGVELSSLEYVWGTAVKDTVLENAELQIDFKQAKAKCLECETVFEMEKIYDSCPKCKSHFKNIFQGKELRVVSLEVI